MEPLLRFGLEGSVDIIASNPPYVEETGSHLIQREVRDWEPRIALFAGADGLDFYRRFLMDASRYLKPGVFMVLEIGYSQLDSITDLIASGPFELVDVTPDLQEIPRTICIRKRVPS